MAKTAVQRKCLPLGNRSHTVGPGGAPSCTRHHPPPRTPMRVRRSVLLAITLSCAPAAEDTETAARHAMISAAAYNEVASLTLEPDGLLCPSGAAHCLLGPQGRAAHGPAGTLLLWDFGGPLHMVTADGVAGQQIGQLGEGPGEYRVILAAGLSATGGIVLLDGALQRQVEFTADGSVRSTVRRPLPAGFIMAEFVNGELWAVTAELDEPAEGGGMASLALVTLESDEAPSRQIRPLPLEQPAFGIADMRPHPGLFEPQVWWAISPDGRIVHTKADRFGLDLYDPASAEDTKILVEATPRRVTPAEVERRLRGIGNPRMRSSVEAQAGRAPEHHPAITGLRLFDNGQLWVREAPDAAGGRVRWVILERTGALVGAVTLPAEASPLLARGDRILVNDPAGSQDAGGLQWFRLQVGREQ